MSNSVWLCLVIFNVCLLHDEVSVQQCSFDFRISWKVPEFCFLPGALFSFLQNPLMFFSYGATPGELRKNLD